MKTKGFISGLLVGIIITASVSAFAKVETIQAFYNNIKMTVNGKNVDFAEGDEPFISNGRTRISAKYLAEALGATIKWNETTSTVEITSNANTTKGGETNTMTNDTKIIKSIPEVSSENNPNLITKFRTEDNVELTKYKECSAIKYNDNIYVSSIDVYHKKNINYKISGKTNSLKLYKDNQLILETSDANSINYILYNTIAYINIDFLNKYLED